MRVYAMAFTVCGLILIQSNPLFGWHQSGHMAVARFAWKQLTDKEQVQIARLLKAHPHYSMYLTANCPKELSAPEWAFLRASTWSDWVRGPTAPNTSTKDRSQIKKTYNKPVWHYVDLPCVHPDDAGSFDAAAIRKAILEPEFDDKGEPRHALAALKQCMTQLQDPKLPDADKAVALCWLLHLTGDLHQPLHCTALLATKKTLDPGFTPPDGDRGGNQLAVKVKADDRSAVKLHFYWDALLFRDDMPYLEVETVVAGFLNESKREQFAELKATEFLDWAEEGLEIAKNVVYKSDGQFLKARALAISPKISLVNLDAPVLSAGYQKAAQEVARRRMIIAGYRTADLVQRGMK